MKFTAKCMNLSDCLQEVGVFADIIICGMCNSDSAAASVDNTKGNIHIITGITLQ